MAEQSTTESSSSSPFSHTVPLLQPRQMGSGRGGSTNSLAALLSRNPWLRRGPSMLVRETAARELEERRADWGYSKPVVALDVMWNLAFVAVSAAMIICTVDEQPNVPIRLWICGYALQCLVHLVLVLLEYGRRNWRRVMDLEEGPQQLVTDGNYSEEEGGNNIGAFGVSSRSSFTKTCESLNTMVSFVWWIVGFYWVVSGGEILMDRASRLYWLAVVFLAFDVFFAIFCVVLACLIGIALCCCLPCIIAILYALASQEGASEADLRILPRYRFEIYSNEGKASVGAGKMVPLDNGSGYLTHERILLPEDAECCICLNSYEDGTELHELPCSHHFDSACIDKWLKMNATCPLCKYNVLK